MKSYPEQIGLSGFRELTEITGNWKLETGNSELFPLLTRLSHLSVQTAGSSWRWR